MSITDFFKPVAQTDVIAVAASSTGLSKAEEVEITKEITQVTKKAAKKRK